jgi:hypothetical protein
MLKMIKFESLHTAFEWAFDERESLAQLKYDFELDDEFERVRDVTFVISDDLLEEYLLENTFIIQYENGYAFYDQEDLENNDDLRYELAGILGNNKEETSIKLDLVEVIEIINESLNLNGINSEVIVDNDEIISTIEADNNTTISVIFDIYELKLNSLELKSFILNSYMMAIESFDIDEEFNKLWSPSFGKHNNFTPSEFMKILEEDYQYFKNQIVFAKQTLRKINKKLIIKGVFKWILIK